MPREFKLPDLGEGIAEGEIVKWLVSEGDAIKEDQPMVEVMTDKATVQIPSPVSGKIGKILAKEGDTVKVGATVVVLDSEVEHRTSATAEQKTMPASPTQTQQISSIPDTGRYVATPATRKLARELNVEIAKIRGTGPAGRITDEDVRQAASVRQESKPGPAMVPVQPAAQQPVAAPSGAREERMPIRGIRKRIAERMTKSLQSSAQVTHIDEVDFTQLGALREKLKPVAESKGVKLTYMPFIMKAAVSALRTFPFFNATIDDEKQEIVVKHYYNIGFASDTSNGLLVPVVKDVDRKSILEIAKDIEDLSAKAREGKISLEEIQGGTFTVTNIGTLGGTGSTPIINSPEVAIIGIHKIQKRPVVREGQIVIRDVANVALTFDHRLVDGADAARFTSKIIEILENPGLLLLDRIQFE